MRPISRWVDWPGLVRAWSFTGQYAERFHLPFLLPSGCVALFEETSQQFIGCIPQDPLRRFIVGRSNAPHADLD